MFNLLGNASNMKMKKSKLKAEKALGRATTFQSIHFSKGNGLQGIPWVCDEDRRIAIDNLIISGKLRVPKDWVQLFPVFGSRGHPKITERLALLSEMGVYLLGLAKIHTGYAMGFIEAVRALSKLMAKTMIAAERKKLRVAVAKSLAQLETILPLYWCTITRHQLLHAVDKIRDHGSFWAIHMLNEERMHISIRKMATNQKHILGSIGVNYNLHDNAQTHWRLDTSEDLTWTNEPRRSTFAGSSPLPASRDEVSRARAHTHTHTHMHTYIHTPAIAHPTHANTYAHAHERSTRIHAHTYARTCTCAPA
jgi:hypothetical protein